MKSMDDLPEAYFGTTWSHLALDVPSSARLRHFGIQNPAKAVEALAARPRVTA